MLKFRAPFAALALLIAGTAQAATPTCNDPGVTIVAARIAAKTINAEARVPQSASRAVTVTSVTNVLAVESEESVGRSLCRGTFATRNGAGDQGKRDMYYAVTWTDGTRASYTVDVMPRSATAMLDKQGANATSQKLMSLYMKSVRDTKERRAKDGGKSCEDPKSQMCVEWTVMAENDNIKLWILQQASDVNSGVWNAIQPSADRYMAAISECRGNTDCLSAVQTKFLKENPAAAAYKLPD